MSHVAVQKRIQNLEEDLIKIQANTNINEIEYDSTYILIETKDYETQRRLIEKTKLCPRVRLMELLSGKYNILINVCTPAINESNCFINSVIKSDDMIRSYKILNSTHNVKPKFIPISFISEKSRKEDRAPCGNNCLFCGMYKDGTCLGCPATHFPEKKYKDHFN